MRLRELKYPIAVLRATSLVGGRYGGMSSRRRWDFNTAQTFLEGRFDDAIIYDSEGRKFEVVKIMLFPSQWWYYFGDLAGHFFIPRKDRVPMANVDMELRELAQLSLEDFCTELRGVALANPSWWKGYSSEQEIRDMFKGRSTIAEAIEDIGYLAPPGDGWVKGYSDKVVDLRT